MRKGILKIIRSIRHLEAERAQVLEDLLVPEPFIKGSLSLVKRRCGKPNCHCAREPAHEVWVLASSQGKTRRCQVVRLADVERVRQQVESYRQFRDGLRALEATQKELKAILRGVLEERSVPYE